MAIQQQLQQHRWWRRRRTQHDAACGGRHLVTRNESRPFAGPTATSCYSCLHWSALLYTQNWLKILTSRRRWRWLSTSKTGSCSIMRDDALMTLLNLCSIDTSWIMYNVRVCLYNAVWSVNRFALRVFMCDSFHAATLVTVSLSLYSVGLRCYH